MWKGIDTAQLDDDEVTWQGIGESLFTRRILPGAVLMISGIALLVHYLF